MSAFLGGTEVAGASLPTPTARSYAMFFRGEAAKWWK